MHRIRTTILCVLILSAGATLEGCAIFSAAGKVIETAVVTTGKAIQSIIP